MKIAPQHARTYFTTFGTESRRHLFQVHTTAGLMVTTLMSYRMKGKFEVHAFVVMPNHVHVLLTPAADVSLEKALQFMKGGFSFQLKSKFDVWERGHFDRRIVDREAYDACVSYIHENPVKERLVTEASEYLFSSANGVVEVDSMQE